MRLQADILNLDILVGRELHLVVQIAIKLQVSATEHCNTLALCSALPAYRASGSRGKLQIARIETDVALRALYDKSKRLGQHLVLAHLNRLRHTVCSDYNLLVGCCDGILLAGYILKIACWRVAHANLRVEPSEARHTPQIALASVGKNISQHLNFHINTLWLDTIGRNRCLTTIYSSLSFFGNLHATPKSLHLALLHINIEAQRLTIPIHTLGVEAGDRVGHDTLRACLKVSKLNLKILQIALSGPHSNLPSVILVAARHTFEHLRRAILRPTHGELILKSNLEYSILGEEHHLRLRQLTQSLGLGGGGYVTHRGKGIKSRALLESQHLSTLHIISLCGLCSPLGLGFVFGREIVIPGIAPTAIIPAIEEVVGHIVDVVLALARLWLKENHTSLGTDLLGHHILKLLARCGTYHNHALTLDAKVGTAPHKFGSGHTTIAHHLDNGSVVAITIGRPHRIGHNKWDTIGGILTIEIILGDKGWCAAPN